MSRSTFTYTCRWCGREYPDHRTYNCCGEKCAREWAAENPIQAQLEREKMQQTAEMNEGCGRAISKGITSIMIFAGVALCIAVAYSILFEPTDRKSTGSSDVRSVLDGNTANKKSKVEVYDWSCKYCGKQMTSENISGKCFSAPYEKDNPSSMHVSNKGLYR